MKYFVMNIHWRNRGDEAAIRAMAESIYERDEDAELVIVDNGISKPEDITQYFPNNKMIVLEEYPTRKQFIELVIPYFTKGKLVLGKRAKEFCHQLKDSDIVIHGPGGPSIGDMYKSSESRYLVRLKLAQRMGKKVFFYAPSAGPFQNKIRNIIRRNIYKKAIGIVVREQQSKKYIEKLGIKNVIVSADSALQLKINKSFYHNKVKEITELEEFFNRGRKIVGITITDLMWHASYKNIKLSEKINETFVMFIRWLDSTGYNVMFIPQKFDCLERDYVYMKEVAAKTGTDNVMVLPDIYCSYTQQYIISKLFAVIGMRYHSNIFAYKMKTPFISISYEHKMSGFMKLAGIDENCIDVYDLSNEILIEKFLEIENNYEHKKNEINSKYEEIIALAKKTTEQLFSVLD